MVSRLKRKGIHAALYSIYIILLYYRKMEGGSYYIRPGFEKFDFLVFNPLIEQKFLGARIKIGIYLAI